MASTPGRPCRPSRRPDTAPWSRGEVPCRIASTSIVESCRYDSGAIATPRHPVLGRPRLDTGSRSDATRPASNNTFRCWRTTVWCTSSISANSATRIGLSDFTRIRRSSARVASANARARCNSLTVWSTFRPREFARVVTDEHCATPTRIPIFVSRSLSFFEPATVNDHPRPTCRLHRLQRNQGHPCRDSRTCESRRDTNHLQRN